MAPSPHNTPLHERPSSASRDSEPGPVNASVKAATDRTNLYSKPPLVMKKPCFMCALKAATIITAKILPPIKKWPTLTPEEHRRRFRLVQPAKGNYVPVGTRAPRKAVRF